MDHTYYDSDLQNQNVFLNFEENIALVDNQRYLFCITAFSPEFQMPCNTTQDYQLNQDSFMMNLSQLFMVPMPMVLQLGMVLGLAIVTCQEFRFQ